ncbi:hypothetical protein OP529_002469 [Staphylococcus pseudintermedius]|nr:hypothetical protein [Staphylococcus pseudintermedius]
MLTGVSAFSVIALSETPCSSTSLLDKLFTGVSAFSVIALSETPCSSTSLLDKLLTGVSAFSVIALSEILCSSPLLFSFIGTLVVSSLDTSSPSKFVSFLLT